MVFKKILTAAKWPAIYTAIFPTLTGISYSIAENNLDKFSEGFVDSFPPALVVNALYASLVDRISKTSYPSIYSNILWGLSQLGFYYYLSMHGNENPIGAMMLPGAVGLGLTNLQNLSNRRGLENLLMSK
jgi:hypothetical protein